jgi:regulator of protease activity HflC (stomatin/prohibitin superfamily)
VGDDKSPKENIRRVGDREGNIMAFGFGIAVVVVVAIILSGIKVLNEYERGVIFRLGRLMPERGPGLIFIIPILERWVRIDLRVNTLEIAAQDVITRDNISAKLSAVLYFRVIDAARAVTEVADYRFATRELALTTLRSTAGQHELDEVLSQRESISLTVQKIIDQHTEPWGIKVVLVELRNIDLPQDMQRAIARQAEAERDRRAKIIGAEGEFQAAQRLADAAQIMSNSPITLQLRYLQTLAEIATEKNSTTVFPLPIDLLEPFLHLRTIGTGSVQPSPSRINARDAQLEPRATEQQEEGNSN